MSASFSWRHQLVLSLALLAFAVLQTAPACAQNNDDLEINFEGCSKAAYQDEILIALTDEEPTSVVHRAWRKQCLSVFLDRGEYLDSFLEDAVSEYKFWRSAVLQTGDEAFLSPENESALDELGFAFSDAVDRANEECIEEDDWRIAERAIAWWGQATELDLNRQKYGLDQATFVDRLCTKIYFDVIAPEQRIGYGSYSLSYRIGVRLGENDPHFDIPLDKPEPSIEGGAIIEDTTLDQATLDEYRQALPQIEAELATLRASLETNESIEGVIESLEEMLAEMQDFVAKGEEHVGLRSLEILPENTAEGIAVELAAAMEAIPVVAGRYVRKAAQNPYWNSQWRFTIKAGAVLSLGEEERGDVNHLASGEFRIIWPPPDDDDSRLLGRTYKNYRDEVTFRDYRRTFYNGGCNEYHSPGFTLSGKPRFNQNADNSGTVSVPTVFGPDLVPPGLSVATLAPFFTGKADGDPEAVAYVFLVPLFTREDNPFEYAVDCHSTDFNGRRRDYKEDREFHLSQLFQALLPLENSVTTATFDGGSGNGDEKWTIEAQMSCISNCPSEEELRPPPPVVSEPPPPEEPDICAPDYAPRQCDADLRSAIQECSKLDDWQVTFEEADAGPPKSYCADLDCAGAVARNKANSAADVFNVIKHETDASCSNTPSASCTVTCVGYHD